VLPGGGARSAYQVGALKALAQLLPSDARSPFPVVCGTSAGAILAAVLAGNSLRFRQGTLALERVWRNFHIEQVFRADTVSMLRSGLHLMLALASGGWLLPAPRALFDSTPLRRLLEWSVDTARVHQALDAGALEALVINAASYSSGRSVAFIQSARPVQPASAASREFRPMELSLDHLMASAAIPFLFAPVDIAAEPFGDGAMRQVVPLSAAARLGAERLLIISVRSEAAPAPAVRGAPAFGEMFGFMLDALFQDGLSADLEHLNRVNRLLAELPAGTHPDGLRHIEPLVLQPRASLAGLAAQHAHELPRTIRPLLRMMGARDRGGDRLLSYLLFEAGYTRALIRLGYEETLARREELIRFLGIASDEEESAEPEQRGEADTVGDGRQDHAPG
jgi:NTE family protein